VSVAATIWASSCVSLAAVEADAYELGLELIRAGRYFEAHEELESAWRAAEPAERDFLQGLVHVAVAWYQAARGNRNGCARQLEKAARRLGPYAPAHRGVDVAGTLAQVRTAATLVQAGSLAVGPVQI
jgi:predicted metal-dependent hydrolase